MISFNPKIKLLSFRQAENSRLSNSMQPMYPGAGTVLWRLFVHEVSFLDTPIRFSLLSSFLPRLFDAIYHDLTLILTIRKKNMFMLWIVNSACITLTIAYATHL